MKKRFVDTKYEIIRVAHGRARVDVSKYLSNGDVLYSSVYVPVIESP